MLFDYIARLNQIDISFTVIMIHSSVNYILRDKDREININWVLYFIKRNKNFYVRKLKSLIAKRKEAQSLKILKRHFKRFKYVCRELSLKNENLYNMNETDFRIEYERAHTVVTMKSHRKLTLTDANNRDYISSIECISTADYVLFFFLIVKDIWILEKWYL